MAGRRPIMCPAAGPSSIIGAVTAAGPIMGLGAGGFRPTPIFTTATSMGPTAGVRGRGGRGGGEHARVGGWGRCGGYQRGNGGRGGFGGGGGAGGGVATPGAGGYGGGHSGSTGIYDDVLGNGGGGGAGMGGAVFNEAGTVVITNSTFTLNTASGG